MKVKGLLLTTILTILMTSDAESQSVILTPTDVHETINLREQLGTYSFTFFLEHGERETLFVDGIGFNGSENNTFPTGRIDAPIFQDGLFRIKVFIEQVEGDEVSSSGNSRFFAFSESIPAFGAVNVTVVAEVDQPHTLPTTLAFRLHANVRTDSQVTTFYSDEVAIEVVDKPVLARFTLPTGWSLMSFPVMPEVKDIYELIPNLQQALYWLPSAEQYVEIEFFDDVRQHITAGRGIWVELFNETEVAYFGEPLISQSITVSREWNLIGGIYRHTGIYDPNRLVTAMFGWDQETELYIPANSLEPAKGAWVYSLKNGVISTGALPPDATTAKSNFVASDSSPPPPPWLLVTDVGGEEGTVPATFDLQQNYPNPFNPSTTIRYALPKSNHVKLTVYNLLGSTVATLVDANTPAGNHVANFKADNLPSGIYFYRLEAGQRTVVRRMQLLK